MRGQDVPVVVDPTKVNHFPGSVEFESLQLQVLELFKHLCENKVCNSSFLALTSWCLPVDLRREGLCLFSNSNASTRALVGAILQAVVRVFRRESGPHFDAWCLDLSKPDTLCQDCLNELIANEIHAQQCSAHADGVVCYSESRSYWCQFGHCPYRARCRSCRFLGSKIERECPCATPRVYNAV